MPIRGFSITENKDSVLSKLDKMMHTVFHLAEKHVAKKYTYYYPAVIEEDIPAKLIHIRVCGYCEKYTLIDVICTGGHSLSERDYTLLLKYYEITVHALTIMFERPIGLDKIDLLRLLKSVIPPHGAFCTNLVPSQYRTFIPEANVFEWDFNKLKELGEIDLWVLYRQCKADGWVDRALVFCQH